MRYALSLKYACHLISAEEAEYEDHRNLGLLCPSCCQPVFLIKGRSVANEKLRKTKSGEFKKFRSYQTESYFAHYGGTASKECQLYRTRGKVSDSTITHSNNKSRQQRRKLFEEKIEQVLRLNPHLYDEQMLNSLWYRTFCRSHPQDAVNAHLHQQVRKLMSQSELVKTGAIRLLKSIDVKSSNFAHLNYLNSPLEIKLHKQTVIDVVDYLFSSNNYSTMSWLYRIAAIEAVIFQQFISYLQLKGGTRLPKHSLNLLHARYLVINQGILALSKHNLCHYKQLDYYFNKNKNIFPAEDLLVDILSGILAYTSWRTGFDTSKSTLVPNQLKTIYVVGRSSKPNSYFSLAPQNGLMNFDSGHSSVDLFSWFNKKCGYLRFCHSQSAILIRQRLPAPFSKMKLTIHLNSLDMIDEVATFSLQRQNRLVAQLQMWRTMTKKKKTKQLSKSFKKLDKFEQKLIRNSPTAMFIYSHSLSFEHILLALLNCYLLIVVTATEQS